MTLTIEPHARGDVSDLLDNVPAELKALPQWVVWRYEDHGKSKFNKVPYNPRTGQHAKSNDPSTWAAFAEAISTHQRGGFDGVGFTFSEDAPYAGVDLDHCRDPETGRLEPWASEIIAQLDSYTEASPSGTGVHIIMKTSLPAGGRKRGKIEMYDRGRFFTMTGEHIGGTPTTIEERTAELTALHAEVFGKNNSQNPVNGAWSKGTANGYANALSDEEIPILARHAKNGDKFTRLFAGDITGHSSPSEADLALCNIFAFYCGSDPARIDRLFRQSGLYRKKWDEKHFGDGCTYGEATIAKALAGAREFYSASGTTEPPWPGDEDAPPEEEPRETNSTSGERTTGQHARGPGLPLTSLKDLLNEPEEAVSWLVDKLLPASGFSLLVAKPKAGKSTLARNLALAVAQGRDFFGKSIQQGPVIYLALEEKRSEVRKHFQDMGATGEEEIYIYAASAPVDALRLIRAVAEEMKPALIIVDPLFKLTRIKDGNDYAQVIQALEPLLTLARETGAHVLCVHHAGKGEREGGDAILGSTAIFAAVDTALLMKRTDRYRTLSSIQRYGEDLPETVLHFDPQTRTVTLGESKEREEEQRLADAIVDFLKGKGEPVTEAEIDNEVEGRRIVRRRALLWLVQEKKVQRLGKGGKKDPFRYMDTNSWFSWSHTISGTTGLSTEKEVTSQ